MNKICEINEFFSKILFGNFNIDIFIVTLIAGVFGFIIAAIPFTIQVLEIKNNENIKLVNKNKTMKRQLFTKYFDVLKAAFWLFLFLICIKLFNVIQFQKCFILNIFLIIFYFYLNYKFFNNLYKLITILQELVNLYLYDKE